MQRRRVSSRFTSVDAKHGYRPRHLVNGPRRHYWTVFVVAALFAGAIAAVAVAGQLQSPAPRAPQTIAAMNIAQADGSSALPDSRESSTEAAAKAPTQAPKKPDAPASKVLKHEYQAQINGYYCGPAATRLALTARGFSNSQDDLAGRLGTTVNGTNSADDITRVLNAVGKTDHYKSTFIKGTPTRAQIDRFQTDVVNSVAAGFPVVTNIAGAATDNSGNWRSFPGGHYITVVGYSDKGQNVRISDPANVYGIGQYWMSTTTLAKWMATRGYSA